MEATLAAIDTSDLNAFSFLDRERAVEAAAHADVSAPFGGVPIGVKELEAVEGWPDTHASVPLADQIAPATSTHVERLVGGGAVPIGLTTSSEFGAVNVTRTTRSLAKVPSPSSSSHDKGPAPKDRPMP